MCSPDCLLAILAVLFPPIAVWIKVGVCSADSIINIALCCLGYVPGLLHAWYIVLKYPEPDDEHLEGYQPIAANGGGYQDPEGNRITYYYVAHEGGQPQRPHEQRNYGTTPPFSQQQYAAPPPVPARPSPGQQQQPTPKPDSQSDSRAEQNGETSDGRPPPTYAEAVKADNKIQSQD